MAKIAPIIVINRGRLKDKLNNIEPSILKFDNYWKVSQCDIQIKEPVKVKSMSLESCHALLV